MTALDEPVCAIKNCDVKLAQGRLMCVNHWRMVPADLGARVYEAWEGFRFGGREAVNRYRRVRREAIDFVEKAERKAKR